MNAWVTEVSEFSREAYVEALRRAEALPDDDPDKADLVAARKSDLRIFFDPPRRSPEESRARLRSFLIDPPA